MPTFPYTLRPFQQAGVEFLHSREGKRGLIYDDAGMGKTFQGLEAREGLTLVITRGYATQQWQRFIEGQYPHTTVKDVTEEKDRLRRQQYLMRAPPEITIVNTEMLRNYQFQGYSYETIIVDESHHFRGRTSQQSMGLFTLCNPEPHSMGWLLRRGLKPYRPNVTMLTASPVVTEADDLWMPFHIFNPTRFGAYWKFCDQYLKLVDGYKGKKVVGVKDKAGLRRLFLEYALGREYKEAGLALPPIIPEDGPEVMLVDMPADVRAIYNKVKKDYRLQWKGTRKEDIPLGSASEVNQILRSLVNTAPKYDTVIEKLTDLKWPPTIVYTYYRETARNAVVALQAALKRVGRDDISVVLASGDVAARNRLAIAQSGHIVVATIRALNEAVDLSHLRAVFYIEEDTTYGGMDQSFKRIRRFRPDGSTDPVLAFEVLCKNSIEMSVHRTVLRRFGDAKDIMWDALWED